jgi:hypothetical protein
MTLFECVFWLGVFRFLPSLAGTHERPQLFFSSRAAAVCRPTEDIPFTMSADTATTGIAMQARSSVVTAMLGSEEALKPVLRTTYEVESAHRRLYTGGKLAVAGEHMMCLCGGEVSVIELNSHSLLRSLEPLGAALSFALHPSGHSAATCGGAAQLQRWDLLTGAEEKNWKVRALENDCARICSCVRCGQRVAVASVCVCVSHSCTCKSACSLSVQSVGLSVLLACSLCVPL